MAHPVQELAKAEVPGYLERADSPLAKAGASFRSLFPKGFALPVTKKRTTYTDDQIDFVTEKFDQGRAATAKKAKPEDVEEEMRLATVVDENGLARPRFEPSQWLTENQIKYLFCQNGSWHQKRSNSGNSRGPRKP